MLMLVRTHHSTRYKL